MAACSTDVARAFHCEQFPRQFPLETPFLQLPVTVNISRTGNNFRTLKVAGSRPDEVNEFYQFTLSFQPWPQGL
jgi:hypothetical protein